MRLNVDSKIVNNFHEIFKISTMTSRRRGSLTRSDRGCIQQVRYRLDLMIGKFLTDWHRPYSRLFTVVGADNRLT